MKIKILSLSILSSLLLVGCGGGGSDDHHSDGGTSTGGTDTSTKEQQWTAISLGQINDGANKGALGYEEDVTTLKDGKYYAKYTSTLDPSATINQSILLITQDGVYEDGQVDAVYGTYVGDVEVKSNNWILSPYSKIGSKGQQFIHSYRNIDISGKLVNQIVNPYHMLTLKYNLTDIAGISNAELKFYDTNKDEKFPAGSSCLQPVKYENAQGYIELDLSTKNTAEVIKIWQGEANKNAADTEKKMFKDTTAYITYQYNGGDTYAKYKDDFYSGSLYSKGIEFTFDDYIKELADDLVDSNFKDKAQADEYLNAAKNQCWMLNEVASKTVHTAISKVK